MTVPSVSIVLPRWVIIAGIGAHALILLAIAAHASGLHHALLVGLHVSHR